MKDLLTRHRREMLQHLANNAYEITENGSIFMPRAGILWGGAAEVDVIRDGALIHCGIDKNRVVVEGLNYLLNAGLHQGAQVGTWYCSLFVNNLAPAAGLTAAAYDGTLTELTAYDEATRPVFTEDAAAGGVLSNLNNRATFTINGTVTNWGAAILSASAKQATDAGQVLLAAIRYADKRDLKAGDQLLLGYSLTGTST